MGNQMGSLAEPQQQPQKTFNINYMPAVRNDQGFDFKVTSIAAR